ncbi:hypothetical protein C2G38_1039315 [Gigaspora rosea]|uniref:Uncharacterized protein n=1 Tax=Gigaspora rosea TaxID=44941 RepID=A0A397VSD1_9GLOM|nr:hypothetical protein C2G38_1039315 [Gigaspora rosea]
MNILNMNFSADNPYIQHHKDIINKPLQQEKPIFNEPPTKKQPRKLNIGNMYSSNIDFEVADPIIVNNSTIPECGRFHMRRVKVDCENNPFVNWKIMPNFYEVPKNYYAQCSKTETIINGNRIRIDGFSVIPKNMDSDAFFEMEIELNEGFSYCVFNYQEEETEEFKQDNEQETEEFKQDNEQETEEFKQDNEQDKVEVRDENKSDEITILSQDGKSNNEETTQIFFLFFFGEELRKPP